MKFFYDVMFSKLNIPNNGFAKYFFLNNTGRSLFVGDKTFLQSK